MSREQAIRGRCSRCDKTEQGCLRHDCGFRFYPIQQWRQRKEDH